jgi:hypothetical protein
MNWSTYSRFVGGVFGAPLAMRGILAFFLESTFRGGREFPAICCARLVLVSPRSVFGGGVDFGRSRS